MTNYKLILSYIQDHKGTYSLKVASDLGIDRTTTNKIIHCLHEDGLVTFKWKPMDARIIFLEASV